VQISHLAAVNENKGKSKNYLKIIDEARNRGIDVMCDSYPYLAGSTILQAMLPQWAGSGGTEAILSRLKDEQTRKKIIEQLSKSQVDWTKAYICSVKTETNKDCEGRSFSDIAAERGVAVAQLICDLLVEEDLEVCFLVHTGNESDVQTIMSHHAQMIGSDGLHLSGKMHPRLYGAFARYLGRYARELNVLTLENIIRKMTSLPAQRLGLQDRGILKVGMAADVVIFDPETVRDLATYDEPCQYPEGIPYVIVNGQIVKRENEHTGALAGQVLKKIV
jgi:N-acyl-D-amino-acid deacylase